MGCFALDQIKICQLLEKSYRWALSADAATDAQLR